jgi:hypothetical protein
MILIKNYLDTQNDNLLNFNTKSERVKKYYNDLINYLLYLNNKKTYKDLNINEYADINNKLYIDFYQEDFWECPVEVFMDEFDKFEKEGRSFLFYLSNLINVVKLIVYSINKSQKQNKSEYAGLILQSCDCTSENMNKLYIKLLTDNIITCDSNYQKSFQSIFIGKCIIYLSLNVVDFSKLYRLEYTNILASTINPFKSNDVCRKLQDDFFVNNQIQRRTNFDTDTTKLMFKRVHNSIQKNKMWIRGLWKICNDIEASNIYNIKDIIGTTYEKYKEFIKPTLKMLDASAIDGMYSSIMVMKK